MSRLMRRLSNRRGEKGNTENGNVLEGDSLMSETTPKLGTVSIPRPGIPENIPVNIDVELYSLASNGSEEGGECK
jgi:hypothetical protein